MTDESEIVMGTLGCAAGAVLVLLIATLGSCHTGELATCQEVQRILSAGHYTEAIESITVNGPCLKASGR